MKHGRTGYDIYKCRCSVCRTAKVESNKKYDHTEKGRKRISRYNAKNIEFRRRYRKENREFCNKLSREDMEIRRFGNNRNEIMFQIGAECQRCKISDIEHKQRYGRGLSIHHKDNKGRNSVVKNNNIDNLIPLCVSCHARHHHLGKKGENK